jgi:hypothetical protein
MPFSHDKGERVDLFLMLVNMSIITCIIIIVLLGVVSPWSLESQGGTVPSERGGGKMRFLNHRRLLLFGGFRECFFPETGCEHQYYNDLHLYDTVTETWSPLTPAGAAPSPRAFFGATAFQGDLYVYGGAFYTASATTFQIFGDFWRYNWNAGCWQLLSAAAQPGPRIGGELVSYGNYIYLFAGVESFTTTSNALWRYHPATDTWTLLSPSGVVPPTRYIFPFEARGGKLTLYGGNSQVITPGIQRNDSWQYSIATNKWTQIAVPFRSRVHCGASWLGGDFLVYFGDIDDNNVECENVGLSFGQNPTNETWLYTNNPFFPVWYQLQLRSREPRKRIYYDKNELEQKIYVWGGFGFDCSEDRGNGTEIYYRDMLTLDYATYLTAKWKAIAASLWH